MTASLMAGRERFDPKQLGPAVMEFYATSLERGLAARERQDARRFFDVDYRRFVDAPLAVAKGVYAHFELPLPAEAAAAFEEHVRANPRGKHGAHRYALEEYGLTSERVRERFAGYIERFSLPSD
jgi:hypothetical protein